MISPVRQICIHMCPSKIVKTTQINAPRVAIFRLNVLSPSIMMLLIRRSKRIGFITFFKQMKALESMTCVMFFLQAQSEAFINLIDESQDLYQSQESLSFWQFGLTSQEGCKSPISLTVTFSVYVLYIIGSAHFMVSAPKQEHQLDGILPLQKSKGSFSSTCSFSQMSFSFSLIV